jgi:hypothetical protein
VYPSIMLDLPSKPGKRLVPKAVEPRPYLAQATFIDLVEVAGAGRAVMDKACAREHPEMLRDSRPTDWQPAGYLANRHRSVPELFKDPAPRFIAKRIEHLLVTHEQPLLYSYQRWLSRIGCQRNYAWTK